MAVAIGPLVGERIGKLIRAYGLSKRAVALRANLDPGYLGRLVKGDYPNPGLDTVANIVAAISELTADEIDLADVLHDGRFESLLRRVLGREFAVRGFRLAMTGTAG